jgi:hypothetical protein
MKIIERTLLLFAAFTLFTTVEAQTYSPQQIKLAERFDSLSNNAPPESAYIQTSKDIYETGEDLWFKVYLLNSHTLSPSELSKTLYLQLVREDTKEAVWQEKYEIEDGVSNGRILLKEEMDEGTYLIEAFTANSFFADSSEFTAVRKVKVVKDITHLRQIKAEFDKKYYGNTDSLKIKLLPIYQKDTSKIGITATLKLSGDVQSVFQTTMKLNEEKELSFKPQSLGKGTQVVINSKYQDYSEEVILPVPCRKNPIQFNVFPEGGTIISGIKTRVAFKAVNINGEPVNVNGTLYKNDSIEFAFISTHDGMGSFDFMPVKNAKYYIRLNESLTDSIYSFPEIEPEGLTLRLLSRGKDYLNFLVSKNFEEQFENIYLMVQIRGIIYGLTEAKLDKNLKIKVPLADMPQGIAEVTLFNDKMMPVAERLVYINPQKKIKIHTILPDSIYPTRSKVNLKIITMDENNNPIKANIGLTVFDKLYENPSDSINILTQMYLSTQLKGRIYNPGYYFNEKNVNRESALDLLLTTQGWRRYIWNNANLKKLDGRNTEIVSDDVKGQAYLAIGKKRQPKDQVYMMAFSQEKDSTKIMLHSDSEGQFTVDYNMLKKWKNGYAYIKPFGSGINQLKIIIDDPFQVIDQTLNLKALSYPSFSLKTSRIENAIAPINKLGVVIIKGVSIMGQKTTLRRDKYLGSLDSISNLNPTRSAVSPMDWVCKVGVWDCPNHSRDYPGSSSPVPGKVYYDAHGMRHVAGNTIPNQELSEEALLKKFNIYKIKSYNNYKEFYQPNYDKEFESISVPDYRNTLMWAPSIVTNDKGEATVSFYCSDFNTEFVGRIEGVGGVNLLGIGNFKFTVRKLKFNP